MEEDIRKLINDVIVENGYILDDVIYEKEGNIYFLRVILDKQGYVNIEDCVKVSKLINPILDEADLIKDSYILDVESKEKGSVSNG